VRKEGGGASGMNRSLEEMKFPQAFAADITEKLLCCVTTIYIFGIAK
jgi:hypothetical protein